jgi:hypothetical protein
MVIEDCESADNVQIENFEIDTSNLKVLGINEWIGPEKMLVDIVRQVLDAKKQ